MDLSDWTPQELELHGFRSVLDGGRLFCGVSEEQFAINGVTYQWPRGSHLTWGLTFSKLGNLSDMDCKDCFTAALKEISSCCDMTHEYVANPHGANVMITVQRLDGPNGVLADCQIPVGNVNVNTTQLLMRLDDSEQWVISDNPQPGTIDLYRVFLHEIEHGHGLGHKPASIADPALIAPIYSTSIRHLQQSTDVAELVRRYGLPETQAPTAPTPADVLNIELSIMQGTTKYLAKGVARRQ